MSNGKVPAPIVIGGIILGLLLLKAIFDRNTRGYRCPGCNLVIGKYTNLCPRCGTVLDWTGVP